MGILKNIFNKNDTDDKKSAKEWTYPDWLPEEEYPAYEACKKESLAFEESIHRYAAKPINTDLYVYCFVDNVLDKKKSTKESLERIKNEHDILMERYYELRRIPGIWNQEMPDGYDVLKTTIETQKWVNNKFQTVNPDAKPIILKLGETSRFVERKESVEDYTNGATKADIYTMVYDYSDIEDIMNMLCPELYDKDASDRTNKVSLMEWVDKNNKWITLWSMIRDDDKD